ncbi:PROF1 protein, partial [Atractosteus spatula]|nr:PROF1 protein [Atractosteus spatula]
MSWDGYVTSLMTGGECQDAAIVGYEAGAQSVWAAAKGKTFEKITLRGRRGKLLFWSQSGTSRGASLEIQEAFERGGGGGTGRVLKFLPSPEHAARRLKADFLVSESSALLTPRRITPGAQGILARIHNAFICRRFGKEMRTRLFKLCCSARGAVCTGTALSCIRVGEQALPRSSVRHSLSLLPWSESDSRDGGVSRDLCGWPLPWVQEGLSDSSPSLRKSSALRSGFGGGPQFIGLATRWLTGQGGAGPWDGQCEQGEIAAVTSKDRSSFFINGVTLGGVKCSVLRDRLNEDGEWTMDLRTKSAEGQPTYNITIAKSNKGTALLIHCSFPSPAHFGASPLYSPAQCEQGSPACLYVIECASLCSACCAAAPP